MIDTTPQLQEVQKLLPGIQTGKSKT